MRSVVESWHIEDCSHIVVDNCSRLVHTHSHRSCRVFSVADVLEPKGDLGALVSRPLIRNLVSDTPHHDSRAVSVMADKIYEILFCPVHEVHIVSVPDLRGNPAVKCLCHKHHTHLVASFDELRSRHIM